MWNQVYNPLGSAALSTIAAAVPVVTLLVLIASGRVKAHIAAIIAVIVTNLITIFIFTMPAGLSIRASLLGVVAGFFPIGWIVLNVMFLSARRFRPVTDRQYRSRRLRRARHADPGPGFGDRSRSVYSGRDGRTAIAGFLPDRAVLGGMGVRRL